MPASLAALLGVTALLGLSWSVVTPAFQAPDENAHFAYLQSMGERFALPGDVARRPFSTEQSLASDASNADQAAAQRETRMQWSANPYRRWRARERALPATARSDGGGPNPATANPPLYYLYEAGAYRLAKRGDIFTRLEAARLASVVWFLVTVLGVWLLAGEAFGRNRLLQLAAAGFAALAPMVGFVSATVNPDAMLYGTWSVVLWLGLRLLKRGLSPGRAGALLAAVGVACVVKATSYALLPAALFAVAVAVRRARGGWRRRGAALVVAAVGLALTLGAWVVFAHLTHRAAAAQVSDVAPGGTAHAAFSPRAFASYLWQFYLPRLPFQRPFHLNAPTIPVYDIWFRQAWGAFGWLEVQFPGWLYALLAAGTVCVAALTLRSLWRRRRTVDFAALTFLVVVAVCLLAGLHWTEYRFLARRLGPFNSGRYLLPLVGVAGLVVAEALRPMRPGARGLAIAGLLGGLFALDLYSLGLMLVRFYA